MIPIRGDIALQEDELNFRFVRASGPGGQKVNKVATAVQLRFDLKHTRSLPDEVKERVRRLAGRRVTHSGMLVIDARRYRTQERNREDAQNRLIELIKRALDEPKRRRATRPSRASIERRLKEKRRRARTKHERSQVPIE